MILALDSNNNINNAECNGVEQVSYFISKAFSFFETVKKHGLDGCWKVRSLLDGKALFTSLELPRGPIIRTYLDCILVDQEMTANCS